MEHLTAEQLLDYAEGRSGGPLARVQAGDVSAHLATCAACRAELASLQQVTTLLAAERWITPPSSARAAVQRAYRQQFGPQAQQPTRGESFAAWLRGLLASSWKPALALAVLGIFAAVFLLSREEPGGNYAASVASASGTVERLAADGATWNVVGAGSSLQSGDQVRTGSDGSLLLTYPDGSSTALLPSSTMIVSRLEAGPRTIRYELNSGESFNRVAASQEPEARFEVNTPTASIGAEAAEFRVVVDTLGTTLVRVSGGALTVSGSGRSLALVAGQEATVASGQPPRLLTVDATPTPDLSQETVTPTAEPPAPPSTAQPSPTPSPDGGSDDNGDDDGGDDDASDNAFDDDASNDDDDDDDDSDDD